MGGLLGLLGEGGGGGGGDLLGMYIHVLIVRENTRLLVTKPHPLLSDYLGGGGVNDFVHPLMFAPSQCKYLQWSLPIGNIQK